MSDNAKAYRTMSDPNYLRDICTPVWTLADFPYFYHNAGGDVLSKLRVSLSGNELAERDILSLA